jgi:hypothetical protein
MVGEEQQKVAIRIEGVHFNNHFGGNQIDRIISNI